jgi:hypothetical protein
MEDSGVILFRKAMQDAAAVFYASGPACWGPLQWMTMHQMARGYPDNPAADTQAALKAYMVSLGEILPCKRCAMHWKDVAPTVQTDSRDSFLKWTIDVHNSVNKRTGKEVLSYAKAIATIMGHCKDNCLSISEAAVVTVQQQNRKQVHVLTASTAIAAFLAVAFIILYCLTLRRSSRM